MLTVADVFAENAYFFLDPASRSAFLIDPGAEPQRLVDHISANNLDVKAILLTHGHFDHTGAIAALYDNFALPYYISPPGEQYLLNPQLNLSANFGRDSVLPNAKFFQDGDVIRLPDSNLSLQVIATPGHTPDSVTFYSEQDNAAFVGDAIFRGQPGTSQFPGGSQRLLMESITEKILKLPDDVTLYSGHTPPTSVGREKPSYLY